MSLSELLRRNPPQVLDPASRYAASGTVERASAGGRTVVCLRRRLVPLPEHQAPRAVVVPARGERPDALAARALGDPLAVWVLADANGVLDPWELVDRARVVVPARRHGEQA